MGWKVGDLIGIAKTTQGKGYGQQVKIAAIEQFKIIIEKPLVDTHWGGLRDIEGYNVELAAEIINLSRNVLITGDYDRFDTTNNGIHTLSVKGEGTNVFDVRYTRIENCGQQGEVIQTRPV